MANKPKPTDFDIGEQVLWNRQRPGAPHGTIEQVAGRVVGYTDYSVRIQRISTGLLHSVLPERLSRVVPINSPLEHQLRVRMSPNPASTGTQMDAEDVFTPEVRWDTPSQEEETYQLARESAKAMGRLLATLYGKKILTLEEAVKISGCNYESVEEIE